MSKIFRNDLTLAANPSDVFTITHINAPYLHMTISTPTFLNYQRVLNSTLIGGFSNALLFCRVSAPSYQNRPMFFELIVLIDRSTDTYEDGSVYFDTHPAIRVKFRSSGPGFTLVEMLTVVALLILMMMIIASIFQKATGAILVSRTYQELDNNLRLLDQTIRTDLVNITAKMTPPNDPACKTGYFEYGENAPADAQGEDTDDYLAFTVKAPQGQPFVGRTWLGPNNLGNGQLYPNQDVQPITITSEFAEVIYFLRNGNLYRRVLLIVPERQATSYLGRQFGVVPQGVFPPFASLASGPYGGSPLALGFKTSWMSMNDISARPSLANTAGQQNGPTYNSLGDLSNRENRYGRQRFCNDYWKANLGNYNNTRNGGTDEIIDDGNFDGIPDYWPTLTASQVYIARNINRPGFGLFGLMNEDSGSMPSFALGGYPRVDDPKAKQSPVPTDVYAFPFIFPGMYSVPEKCSITGINPITNAALAGSNGVTVSGPIGWLHALDPNTIGGASLSASVSHNHAPLDFGDSLPVTAKQTWWGFPTFRETASANWRDPIEGPSFVTHQYFGVGLGGLLPKSVTDAGDSHLGTQIRHLRANPQTAAPASVSGLLPVLGSLPPFGTPSSPLVPFGSDGAGNSGADPHALITFNPGVSGNTIANASLSQFSDVWDDDLIMTGVRSFDVKAYDPNATHYNNGTGAIGYNAGYFDLGYAATDYVKVLRDPMFVISTPLTIFDSSTGQPMGMGHEGRMPPLSTDNRLDAQRPVTKSGANFVFDDTGVTINGSSATSFAPAALAPQRLRRVWDSWSTDYTRAPAVDVHYRGAAWRNAPFDRPIYPSYPAPYPEPLRGIQIQIRVSDVKNERVKILTIRQDFSDKL